MLIDTANPPPAPSDDTCCHASAVQALPAGKAFDQAYADGQLRGHQDLLAIQSGFLNGEYAMTALDPRHVAMLARTTIMSHLTLLQELQLMLNAA